MLPLLIIRHTPAAPGRLRTQQPYRPLNAMIRTVGVENSGRGARVKSGEAAFTMHNGSLKPRGGPA